MSCDFGNRSSQVRPLKRGGGRRYYRPEDVELLLTIRGLLYEDGYTIKGVQKLLRDGSLKRPRQSAQTVSKDPPAPSAAPAAAPKAAKSGAGLSPPQRQALQGLLDELEQLKTMLERALK